MDNQIKVLPVSPNDDRIWQASYHKIFGHDVLWQYQFRGVPPILIVVKNRHVKVEGVVASKWTSRSPECKRIGVSGVFSVENNLRVESD